jgi:uncharacterized membrane protein
MDAPHNDLEAIRRLLADLTTRVYHIERTLGMETAAVSVPPSAHPAPPQPAMPIAKEPVSATPPPHAAPGIPPIPPRLQTPPPQRPQVDLESQIGSHWLNRIGIAAVLIGVAYFLKFAFDNNWIGPAGRVAIGILAGLGIVVWSERFRTKGYQTFSYSLKAVGIGALYLSLWAAFQVYALIPSTVAFVMMFAVTAATAIMAWTQDAQLLAAYALVGGFSTPLLIATGENREVALFSYVLLLDLAALILVAFKPWRRLLVMSFAGTLFLYIGWYSRFYSRNQLGITLAFATLFFAIFAVAPLFARQPKDEPGFGASIPPILAFVNAVVYFLQAYAMIQEVDKTYMAWLALALAAGYIGLSTQIGRGVSGTTGQTLHFLHLAVALGLITVAIPIRLDAHWITIGWFVEAGVLLWVGERIKSELLNIFALGALVLGIARLILIDDFHTEPLLINMRMATYLIAVAVLGAVAFYASKRDDENVELIAMIAVVALNLLLLTALSHEVADYYSRLGRAVPTAGHRYAEFGREWQAIEIERDFTYSALWMAYGTMLMVIGFVRRSAFVRWQALVLIAATIIKVFIYDVSQLDRGYRIVSFIVLGALLLAISFVYQRDWLKLSANKAGAGSPSHI